MLNRHYLLNKIISFSFLYLIFTIPIDNLFPAVYSKTAQPFVIEDVIKFWNGDWDRDLDTVRGLKDMPEYMVK